MTSFFFLNIRELCCHKTQFSLVTKVVYSEMEYFVWFFLSVKMPLSTKLVFTITKYFF